MVHYGMLIKETDFAPPFGQGRRANMRSIGFFLFAEIPPCGGVEYLL